jgi:4-hydroxy-tetrahydrodipicolinate synthase
MLSGDDPSALGYMAHGGHGCISVTSNVAPAACARFFDACLEGDWPAALALQDRLVRLHKALFLSIADQVRAGPPGALLGRDPPADCALR